MALKSGIVFLISVLIVSVAASPLAPPPQCANPEPGTCTFYTDCLEATHPCGASEYALGYGFKYCNEFRTNVEKFTPKGQLWIGSVMSCLQVSLIPTLTTPATCPVIRKKAFDTHSDCYLTEGFCTLPIQDWVTLIGIVDLQDLFGKEGIVEMLQTAAGCGKEYFKALLSLCIKNKLIKE